MKVRLAILPIGFLALAGGVFAQDPVTGIPPFASVQSAGVDNINRQNLNVNIILPTVSVPQRGGTFTFSVVNDSLIWVKNSNAWTRIADSSGNPTWGWKKELPTGKVTYSKSTTQFKCFPGGGEPWYWGTKTTWSNYAYIDSAGTRHSFPIGPITQWCDSDITGVMTGHASDGSGFYGDATSPDGPVATGPSGNVLLYSDTFTDTNGNYISKSVASNVTTWTDTAGHTALKIDKSNANYIDYQFQDTNGAWQTYRLNLDATARSIKTNFACSGVSEYTGTDKLPISLVNLVNNQTFSFTYEGTPGFSGYYTGRLKRITLPTGGYIEYEYPSTDNPQYSDPNNGINCSDGTVNKVRRHISDGTTTQKWEYSRGVDGANWKTIVTSPTVDYGAGGTVVSVSTYTFNTNGQILSEKHYQTSEQSGNLLREITTTWGSNGTPASTLVTLADTGQQTKTDTTFDNYGNLTQSIEYGWYSGSWTAVRTTQVTYLSASGYTSRNIRNRPTQIIVREGGITGTIKSRTDISYDQSSYINTSCPTGAAHHDDATYHCTYTYRGLPTTVTTYSNAADPPSGVTTDRHSYYDWFGNLRKTTVNSTQQGDWTYSSTTNYAFPDSVTSGPPSGAQLTASATYNSNNGLLLTVTDENNKTTSLAYDNLKRLTSVTRPDSQQVSYTYDDSARTVKVSSPVQGTDRLVQKSYFDTLGRGFKSAVLNGAETQTFSVVESQFDALGRVWKRSNPYTASPTHWTEIRLDALGRTAKVIAPDTAQTTYSYSGNTVTVTDPSGKQRKSETDALGRLSKMYEPDVANGNTLTKETLYTYNAFNLLTGVTYPSPDNVQSRSYTYDDLRRLLNETTPEAGTWSYTYNVYNQVETRTDARNVVTTYTYDTLNRPYQISYNVGSTGVPATNTITYTYGTSAASNNNGRLTNVTNTSASDSLSYDALGRVTQLDKLINGTTYTLQYAYNLASEVTAITYPSSRVINQEYDAIGRTSAIKNGTSTMADQFTYNAAGQVTGLKYNGASDFTAAFGFSVDRLQLNSVTYQKGTTKLLDLALSYGSAASNNGQILSITDNTGTPEAGRSVTYTYDALGRLKTAVTTGSTQYPAWGLQWIYDRYGNRTGQSIQSGCSGITCPTHSPVVDTATNRIHGSSNNFCYDSNGNLMAESAPPCPSPTYRYDAENQVTQYGSATYTMDGAGLRVKRVYSGTTTVYVFSGTKVIAEYENGAGVGSPAREYVYNGDALLAKIEGGATRYYFHDPLSMRVSTDANGANVVQSGHFPFGENWYETAANKLKFTSYERDTESGNDYAVFRYHINRFGRFSSPDPIEGSEDNPQSWNRYGYVANDPINATDPMGLTMCLPWPYGCGSDGGGGGGWGSGFVGARDSSGYCHPKFSSCGDSGDSGFGVGIGFSWGIVRGALGHRGMGILPGERFGIPTSIQFRPFDVCLFTGLCNIGPRCDFGACGIPVGNGFAQAVAFPLALACLANPSCRNAAIAVTVLITAYTVGVIERVFFAKGEQRNLRAAARQVGVSVRDLGRAVEAYKRQRGMGAADNLTYDELVRLAEEVKQGLWQGTGR